MHECSPRGTVVLKAVFSLFFFLFSPSEVEAVSNEGRTRIILTQRGQSNIERVLGGLIFAFLSIARASVHARLITSCQEWKWSSHAGGLRIYRNGHVQFLTDWPGSRNYTKSTHSED